MRQCIARWARFGGQLSLRIAIKNQSQWSDDQEVGTLPCFFAPNKSETGLDFANQMAQTNRKNLQEKSNKSTCRIGSKNGHSENSQ